MGKSDAMAFWVVFLIVFFINLFTPIIVSGLGSSVASHNTDEADILDPPSVGDIVSFTGLNILLVPFWTLSMPLFMNLTLMLPLRVLGWYLILRMIRGN